MRRLGLAAVTAAGLANALPAQSDDRESYRLRSIRISTRNVFAVEEAEANPLFRVVNLLHVPTDPAVLRTELWFDVGDTVTLEKIEELERNLRAFGILAEATAELVETGEEGERDLVVSTRDRFSLGLSGSVSSVGGVGGYRFSVGERNLFGLGKRIRFRASDNEEGESSISVAYTDPQLAGSWYRLSTTVGQTEEGHFVGLDLRRPFKHLEDPLAHGVSFASNDRDVDYFERGESVAAVPTLTNEGRLFVARAFGPRNLRATFGADLEGAVTEYGPATGRDAALIRVPGDTDQLEVGASVSIDWVHSFVKAQYLDALDFTEDIQLGVRSEVRLAGRLRDEEGVGTEIQPLLSARTRIAARPFAETWMTLDAGGSLRWHGDEVRGWRTSTALHAYQQSLPFQTLATSITFDAVDEDQDLPPQLTLGEDNGLRGYPAREFAGSRVVRLNIEDRIHTGIEVLSLHLGLVAFFDAGWVHGPAQGLSQSDAITAAGFGFRLGSSELFGRNVARVDLAFPLDDVGGQDYDLSVSFSAGQVFTFFGNATALRRELP